MLTQNKLSEAAQTSTLRVIGHQQVSDPAHAATLVALIKTYGTPEHNPDKRGFLYAEPVLTSGDLAPDIVLAHPAVGVLVIEVKAYDISYIKGVEAGNLKIWRDGKEQLVSPYRQAQRGMYAIKESVERNTQEGARPLFNAMVALPNITEAEWVNTKYEDGIQKRLILFKDDLLNPDRLRLRIKRFVTQTLHLAGLPEALPAAGEKALLNAFGYSEVLDKPKRAPRPWVVDNLGAEIDALQAAHKRLSAEQQTLSKLETWGHPFLLRGVAGSGKTTVLAYHVARALFFHQTQHQQLTLFPEDRHPLPKIVVVCLNRTLVPLLAESINRAYQEIAGVERPPDSLIITHLNGLMYDLAQQHDHFHYIPMGRDSTLRARQYLDQLDKMSDSERDELRFDALYLDEGQDLPPDALTLLYTLVRPNPRTGERGISIYYDDAQNVYGHPRPTWRDFGLNVEGGRAAFMQMCFRNTAEVVELGLNVLLGTAADERMRVETRRYADIYTLKEKNLVEEKPEGWRVHFAQPSGSKPVVQVFPTRADQTEWVAEVAVNLIQNEHVRPEDILILAGKTGSFAHLEKRIQALSENRITVRSVGGRGTTTGQDEALIVPGALSLGTIYAAKGYDAPITILMDTDQLNTDVTGRALFYVGATRAKRYLLVTGVKTAGSLLDEAASVNRALFQAR